MRERERERLIWERDQRKEDGRVPAQGVYKSRQPTYLSMKLIAWVAFHQQLSNPLPEFHRQNVQISGCTVDAVG